MGVLGCVGRIQAFGEHALAPGHRGGAARSMAEAVVCGCRDEPK
jgi:hypothetical protein